MDKFTIDDWEVSFLYNVPLTVCVIRNLKQVNERYVGVTVCNPHDIFSSAVGRHKALKKILSNCVSDVRIYKSVLTPNEILDLNMGNTITTHNKLVYCQPGGLNPRLAKVIQKAYWEHYKDIEQ